ncbi:MAG TPA: hypothetical protein VJZ00_08455 [Thermoanaerobaculia bacterium]|nr:hypothetical protein [Thermoanaerobaculia bacterium]
MTRPFTRLMTALFIILCLAVAAIPLIAGGNAKPQHATITTNDSDDDDGGSSGGGGNKKNCCSLLAEQIEILKAKVNMLTTGGSGGSGCLNLAPATLARTWSVSNPATGTTGAVTFFANGTYTIVNGTYNAGGSYAGKTTGTYQILPGGAIAFTFTGSSSVNSIAVLQCAESGRLIHFTLGRPLDYEVLTTATPE